MSLRREFVELASQEEANIRLLCRHFGISPKTAYKWLARFEAGGKEALADRSRRPQHSPTRTDNEVETFVLGVRGANSRWGGRKIARRLRDMGLADLAPSTVTGILRRHGCIREEASAAAAPWVRFEHDQPNELWQIDFKAHFDTPGGRCYPLTLLDDHSRFNLALCACDRTDSESIKPRLIEAFRRYGLPVRINSDNGSPFGSPREVSHGISRLGVWLIRLGIRISHSRPYHPQTNGKDERFHRTLAAEVLNGQGFENLLVAQACFDYWRVVYNCERPHDSLNLATPASRYRPSRRIFPEVLAPIEYGPNDTVLRVLANGFVRLSGKLIKVSKALTGLPIAVRPKPEQDGVLEFFFCHQRILKLDLRKPLTGE